MRLDHPTAAPFGSDLLPVLIFIASLALFVPRLAVPPVYIYDEVYHAYTAGQYVQGNSDAYVWYTRAPRKNVAYTWNHPPTGVLMIAGGILLWGDHSYGWRFSSAIFGALGAVLTYRLALALAQRRATALLAAGLLLADGLYFVQSRTGMLDMFGTVFMMAALLAFYRYLTAPAERIAATLCRTGVFLGLAISTKWNALYASAAIAAVVWWRVARAGLRARRDPADAQRRSAARQHLLGAIAGFAVLPALVYLASYVPFFLAGHDLAQLAELQRQIFYYHAHLHATHQYQSRWWEWPLALRPVWYYVSYGHGTVANIYANGNPVLYWSFIPAVPWACWRWWKTRDPALIVLLVGVFGQWLPWALVPRIAFAYHFLPVVPLGCIALALALAALARTPRGRPVAVVWAALVVASAVFFFPIWSAIPLSRQALSLRMWLPTWR